MSVRGAPRSTDTPRTTRPRSRYSRHRVSSVGISSRHGSHQVAQKFRTTSRSTWSASDAAPPSSVASRNGGPCWPSVNSVTPAFSKGSSAGTALDPFEKAGVTELTDGQHGPPFRLATLDGGAASLADHVDRLVVLNFWATWCEPCRLEMPTLETLWREYRDRGLVVLAVSQDRGAPRALIEPWVRNQK